MTWCYDLTNNYALALLFFAVIIKVLMLPFGIKQQKSQIALAKLRPKVAKIEKKYAGRNDRVTLQKKQQEIRVTHRLWIKNISSSQMQAPV